MTDDLSSDLSPPVDATESKDCYEIEKRAVEDHGHLEYIDDDQVPEIHLRTYITIASLCASSIKRIGRQAEDHVGVHGAITPASVFDSASRHIQELCSVVPKRILDADIQLYLEPASYADELFMYLFGTTDSISITESSYFFPRYVHILPGDRLYQVSQVPFGLLCRPERDKIAIVTTGFYSTLESDTVGNSRTFSCSDL